MIHNLLVVVSTELYTRTAVAATVRITTAVNVSVFFVIRQVLTTDVKMM